MVGALDYGISFTQGYGPHHTPHDLGHGLAVARIGFIPGDTDETFSAFRALGAGL
ncbi:MAG: hypothetical protein R2860_15205 [Desulfobacterales bacterium]